MQHGILACVCALVIGTYVCAAHSGVPVSGKMGAADNYYNLLVQGFRAGQLSVKQQAPPALAQLLDPYAPSAYAPYYQEVSDLSYYNGKLYLYFGVTPAVVLFWPYAALTGQYLLQRDAVVIFCVVGFLASVGLLWGLWRRYFAEVSAAVVAVGALALGLAAGAPFFLAQCKVNEVPISCGYALMMLALAAIWKALHDSSRRCPWLAAASLAYGLALGARPALLLGAVVLLVPVAQAWRERRKVWTSLAAATGPLVLIGLGLMLYNFFRFDRPLEFGIHYQLIGQRQLTQQFFSLRYLWFNFRVYFLQPARWSGQFPFVHDITLPPVPAGALGGDESFGGILTDIPLVWLALAVPLAWRNRSAETRSILGGFLAAAALIFWIGALTLGLFYYTAVRYEMEFLPEFVLLAVAGILGLERTLTPNSESGQADRPVWRRVVRWGWSLLLAFSVTFNLLASVKQCAGSDFDMGFTLARLGKVQEAVGYYERALRLKPDFAQAHYNLAVALQGTGQPQEVIGHYQQAVRFKPDFVEAHNNLGNALLQVGRVPEAIEHYKRVLQINSDYTATHNNLGAALMGQGRLSEAIGEYEQVVRLAPDSADAHYNLGVALEHAGRTQEAIGHYEQAVRLRPDFVQARNALARARVVQ